MLPAAHNHIMDSGHRRVLHAGMPSFELPYDLGSTEVNGNPKDVSLPEEERGNARRDHELPPFPLIQLYRGQYRQRRPHIRII